MNSLVDLRTMDDATVRRARILAAATAAGAVFALVHYAPLELVTVSATTAVLLLVTGALAAAAAQLRRPPLLLASGALLVLAGLIRLATYGHGTALIGGASSTAAFLTGLGIAQLGILVAAGSTSGRPAGQGLGAGEVTGT
jgi:hypothetical protein